MPTQASQAALNGLWDLTMIKWYVIPRYPFWKLSFGGIWLIFLIGNFHFYVAVILVIGMKTDPRKIGAVGLIYSVPILMNVIGKGDLSLGRWIGAGLKERIVLPPVADALDGLPLMAVRKSL